MFVLFYLSGCRTEVLAVSQLKERLEKKKEDLAQKAEKFEHEYEQHFENRKKQVRNYIQSQREALKITVLFEDEDITKIQDGLIEELVDYHDRNGVWLKNYFDETKLTKPLPTYEAPTYSGNVYERLGLFIEEAEEI